MFGKMRKSWKCSLCLLISILFAISDLNIMSIANVAVLGLSPSTLGGGDSQHNQRRQVIIESGIAIATFASVSLFPLPSLARAPGQKDISASIQQIQDAKRDLRQLQDNWTDYAIIDDEGRAKSTDGARRILGGIAPQAGSAAIDAAKNTPLYRIDVAFVTVRKAVLEDDGDEWTTALDLERFEELADRIVYESQKADGNFYSVLFAAKGTKMITDIFAETKSLVKQGITDLDEMIQLLKEAGAPGIQS